MLPQLSCANLWPDWIIRITVTAKRIFTSFELWAHTPFMKWSPGSCFTSVSQALQNNLAKIHNIRNHIHGKNFKLKLCTCTQSMALGTHTKFKLEILMKSTISVIHKFQENISESSWNVSETTPRLQRAKGVNWVNWSLPVHWCWGSRPLMRQSHCHISARFQRLCLQSSLHYPQESAVKKKQMFILI